MKNAQIYFSLIIRQKPDVHPAYVRLYTRGECRPVSIAPTDTARYSARVYSLHGTMILAM